MGAPVYFLIILRSITSDFSAPLSLPASGSTGPTSVDEEAVGFITAMGFTRNQAIKALKATVSIKRFSSRIG